MSRLTNQAGFTLIELLLAMTLFVTVMVIATIGFIGMNRTFSRGLVRKNLSEAVQRTTADLTRSIRTNPGDAGPVSCSPGVSGCPNDGWQRICFVASRYVWQPSGGLYRDSQPCNAGVNPAQAQELMTTRYKAEVLTINPLVNNDLYQISGVFRTTNDNAFNNLNSGDPFSIACKGTAQSTSVRDCALEKFQFIVNARGGQEV